MDLSSPETSFVQYAHVYPTKIVSSLYFSRRIAPEKAPAGGKAARCAGRGEGRAGTALSRKNTVHKKRTPAKRPSAALSPRAQRGGNPCFKKERTSAKRPPAAPPPRAQRGKGLFCKKNARAAKGRPCARGGEVQTRAHSSSDLISINFFASSMTLPSKLDGSGS